MQKLYAEALYATPGQLRKGVDPGSFHGRAQGLACGRAVLLSLPRAPLCPRPILLPRVLRQLLA